jgi:tetratricopeptide (TPR) repeat protein
VSLLICNGAFDPAAASRLRDGAPERLRRQLSGDLDAIVLKAMRKEPQRRYGSAEQLSEDLRRHVEGLPVSARRGTVRYRAGKFVRRHRAGVATASVLLIAVVGGALATAWQARVARRQRDLAVGAAHTMVHELAAGLERMVGPTEARLGLLAQAARVFDEASRAAPGPELGRQRVESNAVLSRAYRSLGDAPAAVRRGEEAVRLARALAAGPRADGRDRALLAHALVEMGDSMADAHRPAEADRAYREGLALLEELERSGEASAEDRNHIVMLLTRIGDQAYAGGRLAEARGLYAKAQALARALLAEHPGDVGYGSNHATSVERMADMLYYQDEDTPGACTGYREALGLRRRVAERAPNDPAVLRGLAIAIQNVGWCAEEGKGWPEAQALYAEGIAIQRRLLVADPHNTVLAPQLMGGLGQMGNVLKSKGDLAGAVAWYDQAVRVGTRFREDGRSTPGIDAKTADVAQLQAEALLALGRTAEARRVAGLAERILGALRAGDPGNADYEKLSKEVARVRARAAGAAGKTAAPR